jgi:hypothetical protein
MYVAFIHGPAAAGKHAIGTHLSAATGLPLFHNHLAVDAAKALFDFGTASFRNMRATIWRSAFTEAAAAGRSFIFTFHPEASVAPALIGDLVQIIESAGGRVFFVELICSRQTILERIANSSRAQFGKLTDPELYKKIEAQGGFEFPPLPAALMTIDTDRTSARDAARQIVEAIEAREAS